MKKSSSNKWLKEHFSDIYVKSAQRDGLRARSVYKLMEINQKYHLVKSGMTVVDLGAVPGSWSVYLASVVGAKGKVFALDKLPMAAVNGVEFIQGDFSQDSIVDLLYTRVNSKKVDVVLSDMAPNLSGVKSVDFLRAIELTKQALNFARKVLKPGGDFLIKIFHGDGLEDFHKLVKEHFDVVKMLKPKASRPRSSEVFLMSRGFKYSVGDGNNIQ